MIVSKLFVLAGDAIWTISCPDGRHYTWRIQKDPEHYQSYNSLAGCYLSRLRETSGR